MGIIDLSVSRMLIGQDLRRIGGPGGNLVSWKSKKQGVVSRSSVEYKYRAMAQSVCEIMWLHQLLMEVNIKTPIPVKL